MLWGYFSEGIGLYDLRCSFNSPFFSVSAIFTVLFIWRDLLPSIAHCFTNMFCSRNILLFTFFHSKYIFMDSSSKSCSVLVVLPV